MPTVLIVEDDAHVRDLIQIVLTRAEYRVVVAADVSEAIEKAALQAPDVILLDANAGGPAFGLDLLEEIRQIPSTRDISVVLMTGVPDADLEARVGSCAATSCLEKPFSRRDLLQAVEAACLLHGTGNEAPPVHLYAV